MALPSYSNNGKFTGSPVMRTLHLPGLARPHPLVVSIGITAGTVIGLIATKPIGVIGLTTGTLGRNCLHFNWK